MKEKISEIDKYLKNEIYNLDPNIEVINYSARITNDFYQKISIPIELKEKIKNQIKDKEYTYVLNNTFDLDPSPKIVISNGKYSILYETSCHRLTYLSSNFNIIGSILDKVSGLNFETIRNETIRLNFSTSQYKTVNLNIDNNDINNFKIYSNGKNRIDSVNFNYDKKEISAFFCNSIIQKIIFDLDMNIQKIFVKKNISKALTLKKKFFEVNSYSELIKSIETELEFYNLMTDRNLDLMNQKVFDSKIDFVKIINASKDKINNSVIYEKFNKIYDFYTHFQNDNFKHKSILRQTSFNKYLDFEDRSYYSSNSIIIFLKTLNDLKISLNYFLDPDILESYSYLNSLADSFKSSFDIEIKNYKNNTLTI